MSTHLCNQECEHYRSPLEQEIRNAVLALLKLKLPPCTRAVFDGPSYLDVRVVCGGCDSLMCYYCVLKPGHTGKCYSSNKQVYFQPRITT